MMYKLIQTSIGLYRKLPFHPLKRELRKTYNLYKSINRNRTCIITVDGITYELYLSERIDCSIYYEGGYEEDVTQAINSLCREGMVVLDVGANAGYHTLRLAKMVGARGSVIAFEPASWAFEKLKRNVALNNFDNVLLEKIALSNENKIAQETYLYCSWPLVHDNNAKIHPIHGGQAMKDIIDCVTLDTWIQKKEIKKIDLIKLDVDGYEFKVIRGAIKTLKLHKPSIVMELGAYTLKEIGDNIVDLISLLTELGYKFYSAKDLSVSLSGAEIIRLVPKEGTINIVLSVHEL